MLSGFNTRQVESAGLKQYLGARYLASPASGTYCSEQRPSMWPCCHWPFGGLTCKLPPLYHPHFSQGGNSCCPVPCPGQAARHALCMVGTFLPHPRSAWTLPHLTCTADKLMGIWGDLGVVSPGWVPEQQAAVLGEGEGSPGYVCLVEAACAVPFTESTRRY